ncbi:YceI family protein [Bernardetia sp.]|uniref:YceI family protein n=1 Tax=Bernardetia sp. TaxID=1937974 RepID=UPI0025C30411|nr:YceI family protein [Bernardetia sp.]
MKKYSLLLLIVSFICFSFSTLSNYNISPNDSSITWEGSKLGGSHTGLIMVKEGIILTENQKVTGGKIHIDMNSIFCTDIEERETAQKLEAHLKSADFFDVEKFPLARLEILNVEAKGEENYEVKANLTIKNVTKQISFPAKIKMQNNQVIADLELTIDRTEYDVTYMAESVTGQIKDKFIYNNFDLTIHLVALKK